MTEKQLTKEQLENLFGYTFLDFEVEMFNRMLKAHREGKRIILYPARQSARSHKVSQCFDAYICLEKCIKVDQVFFDELIGGKND